jgi:serine/threonine protein kinase
MIGRTISHYEIQEMLGSGGMGEIYKAHDNRLNRPVAIKVLSPTTAESTGRRRFLQEAQAASALNHPNIITIYDIVSQDGSEFMVMEYVSGKTLADLIPVTGLGVHDTLRYGVQIADALQAAHAAGIVHRDLKPGNVMVNSLGLVKVLDFGLAKFTARETQLTDITVTHIDAPLTVKGSIIGTVSYMSPEQATGKAVDHRSDIFACGLLLYEMVTGRRAFDSDSAVSTLSSILRDDVRPIADLVREVPPEFVQIVGKALRKNPDERWQSMKDLQQALLALKLRSDSGTLLVTQVLPPSAARALRPARKTPVAALVGAGLALLAAAGGGAWWWKQHRHVPVAAPVPAVAAVQPEPAPPPPAPPPAASDAAPADAPLTNQSVIDMVEAKISQTLIINQIRSSKTNFNLSTPEVIRLAKAGVSDAVIEAMRNPTRTPGSVPTTGGTVPRPKGNPPPVAPAPPGTAPAPQTQGSALPAAQPASAAPQPAPAQPNAPATETPALRSIAVADGLPFMIRLTEDVPAAAQSGQLLHFEVTKELRAGDTTVVAKGAAAVGAIVEPGKKKLLGKSNATFRLIRVDAVDGTKLNLRATPARQHDGKIERTIEVSGHAPPKDFAAAAGTEFIAYTDGAQNVWVR